jgi:hypothetical protein
MQLFYILKSVVLEAKFVAFIGFIRLFIDFMMGDSCE